MPDLIHAGGWSSGNSRGGLVEASEEECGKSRIRPAWSYNVFQSAQKLAVALTKIDRCSGV